MTKWVLDQYDATLEYPTLGFIAEPGDILDASAAPDSRWTQNADQLAAETVYRYALGSDPNYIEPTNGHVLTWNSAQNKYVPTAPDTVGLPSVDSHMANKLDDPLSAFRLKLDPLLSTYAQRWKANAAYTAGDAVIAPDGSLVKSTTSRTSSASYTTTNLAAPVLDAPTTATTGGTIAAGTTYFYKVTATNALGETVGSAEVSKAIAAALTTPVNAAFTTATTGGTLAAGTYSYRVSATNAAGETLASTATTQTVAAALAAPVLAAPTTATTGGTLAAATYYYKATAINAVGETIGSNEVSIATTGTTSTVGLSWAAITDATGYKIYRATVAGGESTSPALVATLGAVTTYTDTGTAVSAGAVPATNTTATTTNTVTVNWGAVTGATGYKVYGRTAAGELLIASVGAVTTYTDTGAVTPAGALPAANTTSTDTNTVGLSWAAITDATGYKIYRATVAGGQSTSPALATTLGAVTTYTDTGAAVTAGAVPATNTTSEQAYWTPVSTTAGTQEQAALTATYAAQSRPAWANTATKTFDPATGAYNLNARTLARFRAARADAVFGLKQLHVAVLGDSTSHRATDADPAHVVSWPARMRDQLTRSLGLAESGTGVVHLWNTTNENLTEPRVDRITGSNGSVTDVSGYGVYGLSIVQVANGADANTRVDFIPGKATDEFWLYMVGGGSRTLVTITNGAGALHYFDVGAYYGDVSAPEGGYTHAAPLDGYVRTDTPAVNGGLVVARMVVEKRSDWICQVRSKPSEAVFLAAVEARDSTVAQGIRVSNVSQAGVALSAMVVGTNDASGQSGLPLGVDATQASLYIIALGTNDWQDHGSVATFKTQLTTTVQRAKAYGVTGTDGNGTAPGADVLLMVMPQPNYAGPIPADGINVPPRNDFLAAMYEVADEQDVALIDHSYRWVDYASSSGMFRDNIHPNPSGAADMGVSVGTVLSNV